MNEMISVTLPHYQWKFLISAAGREAKRSQKQIDKSDFVPEPGKCHAGKVKVQGLLDAIETITGRS